ncbi:MAG: nitroreductase family protein [Deltaproteobacteria bacterium]|nr:nitroreductase family protein [Deltaproteobacteria bacterium]
MEFTEVIGIRRSIRFFDPDRAVEREKIQKILEAMRLGSCAMNAHWLRAVVVQRDELDPETFEKLKIPVAGVIMELAPVHIYCYGDPTVIARDRGASPKQLIDVGALAPSHGWTYRFVDELVWPQILEPMTHNPAYPVAMAFDNGGCATQGLLMAYEEGLGACWTAFNVDAAKEAFAIPDEWIPHYLLNVGYPLESREAGGQRPRPPFEQLYFEGRVGRPFRRDEKVVAELERRRMIQAPAPFPDRPQELRRLAQKLGLPE